MNFARLRGVRTDWFFSKKFAKTIISRLEVEKKFFKAEKPIPVGFFTKSNTVVLNRIYTESSFENTFSTLLYKPKQNTKDHG